jgi:hypothetical protein
MPRWSGGAPAARPRRDEADRLAGAAQPAGPAADAQQAQGRHGAVGTARRIGFRVAPGFSERVVFRELFPRVIFGASCFAAPRGLTGCPHRDLRRMRAARGRDGILSSRCPTSPRAIQSRNASHARSCFARDASRQGCGRRGRRASAAWPRGALTPRPFGKETARDGNDPPDRRRGLHRLAHLCGAGGGGLPACDP